MIKLVLGIFAVALLAPIYANASAGGGSDGCGLGWEVTNKKSFLATTTRGTTNGIVPPTFGMTTGTIGCDKHSFAKKEAPAVEFVVQNYDSLRLEMAAGQGENLAALGKTMGCSDATLPAFNEMSQSQYEKIIGNGSRGEMFENLRKEIRSNPALAVGCV